jgi:Kef-type K+ transport system membrane component KefB
MVIGTGMVPRGEVGFVVAGVGAGIGAVSDDMYSVVVFMSIATTLLAPPVLVRLYREREPASAAATGGISEG